MEWKKHKSGTQLSNYMKSSHMQKSIVIKAKLGELLSDT